MSQQRFIQLPLLGALVFSVLVGLYLFASKRREKPDSATSVSKHTVDTNSEDIRAYWTAERMRAARATNMPRLKTLERDKKRPRHPLDPEHS